MIQSIIAFSIKNKMLVGVFTLLIAAGGVWSLQNLNIGAVPDITNNQVQVITQAPSLGTGDIEKLVTYPIEVQMANLPGVRKIRSVSRFGLSVVTVIFEERMGILKPSPAGQ